MDENSVWRIAGATQGSTFNNVLTLDFTGDYTSSATSSTSSVIGTFLVQSTVVSLPAAAWLFGSALVGLGFLRKRS